MASSHNAAPRPEEDAAEGGKPGGSDRGMAAVGPEAIEAHSGGERLGVARGAGTRKGAEAAAVSRGIAIIRVGPQVTSASLKRTA